MKKKIDWATMSLVLASILSIIRIYKEIKDMVDRKKEYEEIEQRLDQIDVSCEIMEGRITFIEKQMEDVKKQVGRGRGRGCTKCIHFDKDDHEYPCRDCDVCGSKFESRF